MSTTQIWPFYLLCKTTSEPGRVFFVCKCNVDGGKTVFQASGSAFITIPRKLSVRELLDIKGFGRLVPITSTVNNLQNKAFHVKPL